MRAFSAAGKTVNIDVGAASANVLVSNSSGVQQVRVVNDGTATAWIQWGTTSAVAAVVATSLPVRSGTVEVFTLPPDGPIYVAAIAAAGTGKIYFTPGGGV